MVRTILSWGPLSDTMADLRNKNLPVARLEEINSSSCSQKSTGGSVTPTVNLNPVIVLHFASRLAPSHLSAQILKSCVSGELHNYFHLSAAVIQTHIIIIIIIIIIVIRPDLQRRNWVANCFPCVSFLRCRADFCLFVFFLPKKKIQDFKPRESEPFSINTYLTGIL